MTVNEFLRRLDERRISYKIDSVREGAVLIEVNIPGHRWEVEFFEDGTAEAERFTSSGGVVEASDALLMSIIEGGS
jgi:hypothetical protein